MAFKCIISPFPHSGSELPDSWSGNGFERRAIQAEQLLWLCPQTGLHERQQHSIQSRETRGAAGLHTPPPVHTGLKLQGSLVGLWLLLAAKTVSICNCLNVSHGVAENQRKFVISLLL